MELLRDEGWLCDLTSGLEEPVRAWLERDLRRLLRRFTEHAGPGMVRAQLAAIRGDQCRKFHCDYVRYRLLSTYVGPGTEWLPEEAVRREALEHPAACPTQANARAVRDASGVRRAAAGDVLLMKGALHPDSRGAVHRSPPIENTGVVRLVWTLSTVG